MSQKIVTRYLNSQHNDNGQWPMQNVRQVQRTQNHCSDSEEIAHDMDHNGNKCSHFLVPSMYSNVFTPMFYTTVCTLFY